MFSRLIIILFFVAGQSLQFVAALKVSAGSGVWTTNGTWSPSGVPACGDSIVIQVNHTVTVNNQQDYTSCGSALIIVIYGRLTFGNGDKLKLPCGSKIYVFAGGSITGAGGGGSSNTIDVCSTTFWDASQGDLFGPACVPANLPGCAAVLPILVSYFEAEACDYQICLNWQTLVEKDNDFFAVERLAGESEWFEVGRVSSEAPGGNSAIPIDYSFADRSTVAGTNYYRLRQFNTDGTATVFGITSERWIDRNKQFRLAQDQDKNEFQLLLPGVKEGSYGRITFYDLAGTQVFDISFWVTEPQKVQVKYDNLSSGVYVCRVAAHDHTENLKFLIR